MKELRHQEGQFVGVLTYRRDTGRSGPVVVQVALLVRQHLQVVDLQTGSVVDDVVRRRGDRTLTDRLRHKVEISSFWEGDDIIDHGTGSGILTMIEESRIDTFVHDEEGQQDVLVDSRRFVDLVQLLDNGFDFVFVHVVQLTLADTISVEDDTFGQLSKLLAIFVQSFDGVDREIIGNFFTVCVLTHS